MPPRLPCLGRGVRRPHPLQSLSRLPSPHPMSCLPPGQGYSETTVLLGNRAEKSRLFKDGIFLPLTRAGFTLLVTTHLSSGVCPHLPSWAQAAAGPGWGPLGALTRAVSQKGPVGWTRGLPAGPAWASVSPSLMGPQHSFTSSAPTAHRARGVTEQGAEAASRVGAWEGSGAWRACCPP